MNHLIRPTLVATFVLSGILAQSSFAQPATPNNPEEEQHKSEVIAAVKTQLAEVSSVPQAAMDKLNSGRIAPKIEDYPNETLSAVFLQLWPARAEAGTQKELDEYVKFVDHVGAYSPSARVLPLFRPGPKKGECSLVQAKDIESVECKGIAADRAHGIVRLNIQGQLQAQVLFLAVRKDGNWQLQAFRIPAWEVETTRGEDGTWKARGECVHPVFGLQLPRIDMDLKNENVAPRIVVTLPAGFPNRVVVGDNGPILSWRGQRYDFAPSGATSFPTAIADHLQRKKLEPKETQVVIRAHENAEMKDVFPAVKELANLGFGSLGIDVRTGGFTNYTLTLDLADRPVAKGIEPLRLRLKAFGRFATTELEGEEFSSDRLSGSVGLSGST